MDRLQLFRLVLQHRADLRLLVGRQFEFLGQHLQAPTGTTRATRTALALSMRGVAGFGLGFQGRDKGHCQGEAERDNLQSGIHLGILGSGCKTARLATGYPDQQKEKRRGPTPRRSSIAHTAT